MKILILDEEFPWPLNTGRRIRSFNLLSRLVSKHSLSYLAYGEEGSESYAELVRRGMNPTAVPHKIRKQRGLQFYLALFTNLFSWYPYIISSHLSKAFEERLKERLEAFQPDLVLCEMLPFAPYLKEVGDVSKVLVTHNVEGNIWRRYVENESNLLKRIYIWLQWRKVAKFEEIAVGWAEGVTAVSTIDAEILQAGFSRGKVSVIENGVDLDYFHGFKVAGNNPTIVFTASLDWRPNQDAIRFFHGEIFPLIRLRIPNIEVLYVGRDPPRDIITMGRQTGVTVTGTVDDIRPWVGRAQVYVVPIRIGGGSRLKILEAFAMGLPVVSTSVGAEGLEVIDGEHLLLADERDVFAETVCKLIEDEELRERLARAGRQLVEEKYGWDSLARRLSDYLELVSSKEAR